MRVPNSEHESRSWRIREIAADFTLLDVWALPVHGRAEDFSDALEMVVTFDPTKAESLPAKFLWRVRDLLGIWLDSERHVGTLPIPGTAEISLKERVPEDLRGSAANADFASVPFAALYRTDVEFAAETSNRTVHGVLHLAWVDQGDGRYRGQMAIYVKPRGVFGRAYMALITPFRYLVVYPALMRQIERQWSTRSGARR